MNQPTATNSHPRKPRFAEFRFYEELNDFLPANQRKTSFQWPFFNTPAVRDVIQAIGVPHTEIDLVLVDGESVVFAHNLKGGERVAVYPVFERLDISPVIRLRPEPLRDTRFIVDAHLGKLARYLRMLGFDAAYQQNIENAGIVESALREKRIILTRSREILKHNRVTHGYWLRYDDPQYQLAEVVWELDLSRQVKPFTRCMTCNGIIEETDKAGLAGKVDSSILQRYSEFRRCRDCGNIYWQGSHHEHMSRLIRDLVDSERPFHGRSQGQHGGAGEQKLDAQQDADGERTGERKTFE